MGPAATEKQISYILTLASKIQGTRVGYLSQVTCVSLNQRQKRGGMTKSEASAIIDELKTMAD